MQIVGTANSAAISSSSTVNPYHFATVYWWIYGGSKNAHRQIDRQQKNARAHAQIANECDFVHSIVIAQYAAQYSYVNVNRVDALAFDRTNDNNNNNEQKKNHIRTEFWMQTENNWKEEEEIRKSSDVKEKKECVFTVQSYAFLGSDERTNETKKQKKKESRNYIFPSMSRPVVSILF